MRKRNKRGILKKLLHGLGVLAGAALLTLAFFLVLPFMQAINKPAEDDLMVRTPEVTEPPPPPPEIEQEPEPEPEPDEPKPELAEQAQPLSLDEMSLALDAPMGEGWGVTGFSIEIGQLAGTETSRDLFDMGELDQQPRVIYQPGPSLTPEARRKLQNAGHKVYVIFIVDKTGRVTSPKVQTSSDPAFERLALSAVKQWKFQPGKKNGKAVPFRMRVPVIFPRQG